jgi:hypothetical protein
MTDYVEKYSKTMNPFINSVAGVKFSLFQGPSPYFGMPLLVENGWEWILRYGPKFDQSIGSWHRDWFTLGEAQKEHQMPSATPGLRGGVTVKYYEDSSFGVPFSSISGPAAGSMAPKIVAPERLYGVAVSWIK